jgi:hypothetical protein
MGRALLLLQYKHVQLLRDGDCLAGHRHEIAVPLLGMLSAQDIL